MSGQSKIISLNITQFPQNLLIPDLENNVSIQVKNNSDKIEKFQFVFEGENLDIAFKSDILKDPIEFGPDETKTIDLMLKPTADGFGKLIINIYHIKVIEYTVKVQKVRKFIPKSMISKIFEKYTLKSNEVIDPINRDEYIASMTIKDLEKVEKQLETMKNSYLSTQTMNSKAVENSEVIRIENIDSIIKKLAKGHLYNNNISKSLELALELSNPNDQFDFYYKLLRVYATTNTEEAIAIIKKLKDFETKQILFKSLVSDKIDTDPTQSFKLTENIDDFILRTKLQFNIANILKKRENHPELIKVINQIVQFLLKSLDEIDDRKIQKRIYEFLIDSMHILAEIEEPRLVDVIIDGLRIPKRKEQIKKDLFDTIYEIVEEIRTKSELETVFSQFFLLNTFVSDITLDIKDFSSKGGNLSNNLILKDFNFNIAFVSLFGFSFSLFPIMDRVYNELKNNSNNSFAYYIFPSTEDFQKNELSNLKNTLTQFFQNFTYLHNQLIVFNLDFIPYLGTPTIILSEESLLAEKIKSKIGKISDKINIISDNSLFEGGKILDSLKQIFPSSKCAIINFIFSYEFLNDYNMLKTVIQSLC
ncbi:MAG: Tetratricopeptide domain protein [Candidatus Lokiarchaeum sp. GC14_75]|nr:MAG: Tetratricopeptide domain protein [Candidatus Lokiarchaeum sp. GC14_75]